jgi:hypothetical protein
MVTRLEDAPFRIYLRLHVQKTSGFKPVLVCINDWPTMNVFEGITTLTEKNGYWSMFVLESQEEIQAAVFALQRRVSIGEC